MRTGRSPRPHCFARDGGREERTLHFLFETDVLCVHGQGVRPISAWYESRFLRPVPIVQRPRTWPFQGQNSGSNPDGDANFLWEVGPAATELPISNALSSLP